MARKLKGLPGSMPQIASNGRGLAMSVRRMVQMTTGARRDQVRRHSTIITTVIIHRNRMGKIMEGESWVLLNWMSIHWHWRYMVRGYILCWPCWGYWWMERCPWRDGRRPNASKLVFYHMVGKGMRFGVRLALASILRLFDTVRYFDHQVRI
jgi:hypothetical protein